MEDIGGEKKRGGKRKMRKKYEASESSRMRSCGWISKLRNKTGKTVHTHTFRSGSCRDILHQSCVRHETEGESVCVCV
jgi:hypothetical protein